MSKVYTKQEVRMLRRGPSMYAPVIVNFVTCKKMLFHDEQGGSIEIADDVDIQDALAIWIPYQIPVKEAGTTSMRYAIKSESGSTYNVTIENDKWSCTCSGFLFRKRCKHLDIAKEKHNIKENGR
jgi:hypothetical protein